MADPTQSSPQRRAALLHAAGEVGKRVTSILDLDELLPKTVDIICDAYGFYFAGVFLIDDSGQWAVLRAGHGEAGKAMIAAGHKLAVGGHSMIGAATGRREARIALDVGTERVHFKNPFLPDTRSEMALPLVVGDRVLGAVTVQSVEERAFGDEDVLTLQTMADLLAVAIHNARTLKELERAHAELLRAKTYAALAAATSQAVHWIGNKALPITTTVARMKDDLARDRYDPESWRDDLDLIEDSARQIVQVKENLLGPAREAPPRPAMLHDVAQAAAFHAGVPAPQVKISIAPGTPLGLVDTTQLVRALGNLYRNALEASAENIDVTIAPAGETGFVSVRVTDDGHGVPPEIVDKIWAPFITTKGATHSGLGLPACLHVITQMHGSIGVQGPSEAGATFDILLPAAAGTPPEMAPAGLQAAPDHILLIDDDDAWARGATAALIAAGKHVAWPATVDEAADAQVILVDETLAAEPVGDVLDTLKRAGAAGKTIVLCTALNVERTAAYLKMGVKDVALKPYTADELAVLLGGSGQ